MCPPINGKESAYQTSPAISADDEQAWKAEVCAPLIMAVTVSRQAAEVNRRAAPGALLTFW